MTLQTALGYVPSNPNLIINGGFTVNQRVYTTGTALAAGVFAHDRWKAGAAGGAYSFTQLNSPTTITITAGTFIQVIDTKNVQGGSYVLSWTGTATARHGLNSATPSGSYVASPILIAGQTAGTAISVEFGTGTLTGVKLEMGTVATPFVHKPYAEELQECQRYYRTGNHRVYGLYSSNAGWGVSIPVCFVPPMRVAPTVVLTDIPGYDTNAAATSSIDAITNSVMFVARASVAAGQVNFGDSWTASAEL